MGEHIQESLLATKDAPLGFLSTKVFENDLTEKYTKEKSQLQRKTIQRFNQTHQLVKQEVADYMLISR